MFFSLIESRFNNLIGDSLCCSTSVQSFAPTTSLAWREFARVDRDSFFFGSISRKSVFLAHHLVRSDAGSLTVSHASCTRGRGGCVLFCQQLAPPRHLVSLADNAIVWEALQRQATGSTREELGGARRMGITTWCSPRCLVTE